ncbi:HD-GYP domain-containing protein [Sulfurospirillum sp. 1612]|uniref:HD-GYP domain-containing protein n=1 Tax=Sulfurospirillum sp. 1612 TaxID=3094835 RepID=UPI002F91C91F
MNNNPILEFEKFIKNSKNNETSEHVRRVSSYTKQLCILLGIENEKTNIISKASVFHDIGKILIPDAILNKADKLNHEEWKTVKTHALLGYEMLKRSNNDIFQVASLIAYSHHEKWDGTGYPLSLRGDEINLFARIVAVVDVFDALCSIRSYKKEWAVEKALDYIADERSKHFDPGITDIFLKNSKLFIKIKNAHR